MAYASVRMNSTNPISDVRAERRSLPAYSTAGTILDARSFLGYLKHIGV